MDSRIFVSTNSNRLYICYYLNCNLIFETLKDLNDHRREADHFNKSLRCVYCMQEYKNTTALRSHVLKTHVEVFQNMNFTCSVCHKVFTHKGALTRHKNNIHYTINKYSCDLCDKEFRRKYDLKRHISCMHECQLDTTSTTSISETTTDLFTTSTPIDQEDFVDIDENIFDTTSPFDFP